MFMLGRKRDQHVLPNINLASQIKIKGKEVATYILVTGGTYFPSHYKYKMPLSFPFYLIQIKNKITGSTAHI